MLKYHKRTKCKRSIFFHTSDEILNFYSKINKISSASQVLEKARKLLFKIKSSSIISCELRVFLFSPYGWNNTFMPKVLLFLFYF